MIKITGLQKRYGSRMVLDIDEFHFRAGVRYALIGPNGSGKTTLLRILAGALAADAGTIDIAPAAKGNMGFMPQHPYAFGFSVLKNVQAAFDSSKGSQKPAMDALAEVGMETFAQAKGNKLSGGEAQRMAIARMIAKPRKLLFLDEPTSSTDIAGNDMIEKALGAYCEKNACTLIFSTHSPAQVQALSEITIMMNHGRIVEAGPTREVLFASAKPLTQAFLKHWQLAPAAKPEIPHE